MLERHPIGALTIIISGLLLAACATDQSPPTAVVVVVGKVSTSTPVPRPTATPLNTPRPRPTLEISATPEEVIVTLLSEYTDIEPGDPLKAGDPLPDIELIATDGTPYALSNLKGKPLIINFWTLGCGSCFFEFPELEFVYQDLGDELGFLPIGINVNESPEQADAVASALGVTFPVVVDPGGAIFATFFGGRFVPTNYFITPDGIVSAVVIGPLDRNAILQGLDDMDL